MPISCVSLQSSSIRLRKYIVKGRVYFKCAVKQRQILRLKMHQKILFQLALCPDPAGRAYSDPQTPYLDLRGQHLREWSGKERMGRDGSGRKGRGTGVLWSPKTSLKMMCNDFLDVKVNRPSYVFNISKSIWILRNIKKLGNFRKAPESDLFTFGSDDVIPGKQTREQATGVLSETLHYTTLQ